MKIISTIFLLFIIVPINLALPIPLEYYKPWRMVENHLLTRDPHPTILIKDRHGHISNSYRLQAQAIPGTTWMYVNLKEALAKVFTFNSPSF